MPVHHLQACTVHAMNKSPQIQKVSYLVVEGGFLLQVVAEEGEEEHQVLREAEEEVVAEVVLHHQAEVVVVVEAEVQHPLVLLTVPLQQRSE